jgi:DNA-binding transcriptional LysR family regulator
MARKVYTNAGRPAVAGRAARVVGSLPVELRHLRYFVAVAEGLGFTRAAARVRTAQPSLSQQIRQLEKSVGVKLLDRSRQHVALTNAGRIFLQQAKDILARVEHAGRLAKQAADGRAGELSVGTFPSADVRILPALRPLVALTVRLNARARRRSRQFRAVHGHVLRPEVSTPARPA